MGFNKFYPIWFARTSLAVNSVFVDFAFAALEDDNEIDLLDRVLTINGQEYHITAQTAICVHRSKIYDSHSSQLTIWAFSLNSFRHEPEQIHKYVRRLYGKAKKGRLTKLDPRYTLVDNSHFITVSATENDKIQGVQFYLLATGWSALN